ELVLLLLEVEDVDAVGAGIGDDNATTRVGDDAVRPHERVKFRLAGDEVEYLLPELAFGFDLAGGVEGALEGKLAAAEQRHVGRRCLGHNLLPFFFGGRRGGGKQEDGERCDL